jgi:acyl-CoA synthetase (AMP-forming)/AMP-acid ligase II
MTPPRSSGATNLAVEVAKRAVLQPQAWAVHTPGGSWRWDELAALIERASHHLATLGVRAGDRLVIVSENSASTLVIMLAAQTLRAWPAVLNARLPAIELERLVECADPRWLLFSLEGSESSTRHAVERGARAIEIEGLGPLAVAPFNADAVAEGAAANPEDDVAILVFTSGTSGQPKAVMVSHNSLVNMGRVVGAARGTTAGDTIDVAAPLSHAMGLSSVVPALMFGAAIRIQPSVAPDELAHAIARGDVQQASMVPAGWTRLLETITRDHIDLSRHRLRTLVAGGAPLDPTLKQRIEHTFGRPLVNAYGMTECAPLSRTRPSFDTAAWSVGAPEAGVEVRIVDSSGVQTTRGEIGEIQARGPGVMLGYYRNQEATRDALRPGGWYATGDLGRWLPDGDLAVVGRLKEMIIRSGFNVYPAEVEAVIATYPAVLHSAVVGRPAALGDGSVLAYIQLRSGESASDSLRASIEAHVRERLVAYKCPSSYRFVGSMPMGPTGKILKRELAPLADQAVAGELSPRTV